MGGLSDWCRQAKEICPAIKSLRDTRSTLDVWTGETRLAEHALKSLDKRRWRSEAARKTRWYRSPAEQFVEDKRHRQLDGFVGRTKSRLFQSGIRRTRLAEGVG